jgi:hypothetical protein
LRRDCQPRWRPALASIIVPAPVLVLVGERDEGPRVFEVYLALLSVRIGFVVVFRADETAKLPDI